MVKEEKASKGGRPKGSKSLGIPQRGLKDALELTKMIYDNVNDKIMSFQEMTDYMKLQKGSANPVVGALFEYGLIERSSNGWKVSDLGKNALFGDATSAKAAFEKNTIFRDLSIQFGDKDITEGILIDYLKKKYKKGENVFLIARRFSEGVAYIRSLGGTTIKLPELPLRKPEKTVDAELYQMARLFGQLFPPSDKANALESIDKMTTLAEKNNLTKFAGFLEGLRSTLANKDDKEIFSELQKISSKATEIFDAELGLDISRHHEKPKDKAKA